MADQNAQRDDNFVPSLLGISSTNGNEVAAAAVDPITNRLLVTGILTGTINQEQPSTPTVTSVGDTTSSTTLLASNSNRLEAEFYNNSTAILYLLKGSGTASSTNYTVQMAQGDYYTTSYTGIVKGVWASDAGGSVLITEST